MRSGEEKNGRILDLRTGGGPDVPATFATESPIFLAVTQCMPYLMMAQAIDWMKP